MPVILYAFALMYCHFNGWQNIRELLYIES